jgi:SNF2 family DNA or RNA helicase
MISDDCISVNISFSATACRVELGSALQVVRHRLRERRLIENYLRGDAILRRKLSKGENLVKEFDIDDISDDKIIGLIKPYILPIKVIDFLYPYQRQGVAWLLTHKRGMLADDMGLGKTYQAISAARRLIRSGRINWGLIVVPKSLTNNWLDELNKWAPEIKVVNVRRDDINQEGGWLKLIGSNHLVITTYESLRGDIRKIITNPPDLIIADEAHRLRKRDSLTFQSFRTIQSRYLWALTGTPIERSSEDLLVMMSLIEPRQFAMNDLSLHRSSLQARARPYFIRRTKSEVLTQLPPVIERTEIIELSDGQRKTYDRMARSGVFSNHLAQFSKLREICDYDEITDESSKIDRIIELVNDISLAKEKVVIFSYTLTPLSVLENKLKKLNINYRILLGELSIDERRVVIDEFKNQPEIIALLASTKIAAEGLTLTEANNVIFVNKWWNPSSNLQARDRVVRIGQLKVVQVTGFKAKRTLEESLERILIDKQKNFDQVISALANSGVDLPVKATK